MTEKEKALLVGARLMNQPDADIEELMEELRRLAETAGVQVFQSMIQSIKSPDPAFFIGSGKVAELTELCEEHDIHVVIFNNNLSPGQQKNLEDSLGVKIVDRTGLILDIFAQRALTSEGKLQVELAQLEYMLPRLTRMWVHLSRLGGGIGTRGPGETQLETDRRRIKTRIHRIKSDLKNVIKHRQQLRKTRKGVPIPVIALVGYTNSGKSTLFQQLTGATTVVEDKLFATLDPLVRHIELPNQQPALLLDTVGFIRALPTQLVAAFKATLEEIQSADLLVHVIDISHPQYLQQIETVKETLADLNLGHLPVISVFNKIDLLPNQCQPSSGGSVESPAFYLSALDGTGLEPLKLSIVTMISQFRRRLSVTLTYAARDIINFLHRHATILTAKYSEEGATFDAELDIAKASALEKMIAEAATDAPAPKRSRNRQQRPYRHQ